MTTTQNTNKGEYVDMIREPSPTPAKHTPGPFHAIEIGGDVVITNEAGDDLCLVYGGNEGTRKAQDAKMIVDSLNSHAAMLEALEDADKYLAGIRKGGQFDEADLAAKIRNIITLAREGK